jgi:hypothetical protein
MSTRTRWLLAIGYLALGGLIIGTAVAQAFRLHSMDPVWSVGWLPAVLVATYPGLLRRDAGQRHCWPRLRRSAGS